MTTFHIDYYNGNDSNDGLSWSTAWKTINANVNSTNISAGDIIKISKNNPPELLGNASWTNNSNIVTFDNSTNMHIDPCESVWKLGSIGSSGSSSVVSTTSSRYGTYYVKINSRTIPDGTSVPIKTAFRNLGSTLNLSTYTKISLWIDTSPITTNSNNLTSWDNNNISICLCSDTSGDVIVNELFISKFNSTQNVIMYNADIKFKPLVLDYGSALGDNIQSIAIYQYTTNKYSFWIDNIVACTTNGLTHKDLLTKESTERGYSEDLYCIKNINNNIITIEGYKSSATNIYIGSTENTSTYRRIGVAFEDYCIDIPGNIVTVNGSSEEYIEIKGGYNTITDIQDGETILDCLISNTTTSISKFINTYGINILNSTYVKLDRISTIRCVSGIKIQNSEYIDVDNILSLSCNYNSLDMNASKYINVSNIYNLNNSYKNLYIYNCKYININTLYNLLYNYDKSTHILYSNNVIITNIQKIKYCATGIDLFRSKVVTISNINEITNCSMAGITVDECQNIIISDIDNISYNYRGMISFYFLTNYYIIIKNIIFSNNTLFGLMLHGINIVLKDVISTDSIPLAILEPFMVLLDNFNGDGIVKLYNSDVQVLFNSSIRHNSYGKSIEINLLTNFYDEELCGFKYTIAEIYCKANKQTTFTIYVRRSNSNIFSKLICENYQLLGITEDVTDEITASPNTWEQLSITVNPTEDGVIQIYSLTWGTSAIGESVYYHDVNTTSS
jgi:hypothetical protein